MPRKTNVRLVTHAVLADKLTGLGTGIVGITIDGGTTPPATGLKGFVYVPRKCTISKVVLLSTDPLATVGSIIVDIWLAPFASYPPVLADSICGSNFPTITSANKAELTDFTGWTTTDLSEGDTLAFNVNSISTVLRVGIFLVVRW